MRLMLIDPVFFKTPPGAVGKNNQEKDKCDSTENVNTQLLTYEDPRPNDRSDNDRTSLNQSQGLLQPPGLLLHLLDLLHLSFSLSLNLEIVGKINIVDKIKITFSFFSTAAYSPFPSVPAMLA